MSVHGVNVVARVELGYEVVVQILNGVVQRKSGRNLLSIVLV